MNTQVPRYPPPSHGALQALLQPLVRLWFATLEYILSASFPSSRSSLPGGATSSRRCLPPGGAFNARPCPALPWATLPCLVMLYHALPREPLITYAWSSSLQSTCNAAVPVVQHQYHLHKGTYPDFLTDTAFVCLPLAMLYHLD